MGGKKRRDYSKFFNSRDALLLENRHASSSQHHDVSDHDIRIESTHMTMKTDHRTSNIGEQSNDARHATPTPSPASPLTVAMPSPHSGEQPSETAKPTTWPQSLTHTLSSGAVLPFLGVVELIPYLYTTETTLYDLEQQLKSCRMGPEASTDVIIDLKDDLDKLRRDFDKLLRALGRDLKDSQHGCKKGIIAEAVKGIRDIKDACHRIEKRYLVVKEEETKQRLARQREKDREHHSQLLIRSLALHGASGRM